MSRGGAEKRDREDEQRRKRASLQVASLQYGDGARSIPAIGHVSSTTKVRVP